MRFQSVSFIVLFTLIGIGAAVPNHSYAVPIVTAGGQAATLSQDPGTFTLNGVSGLTRYNVAFPTTLTNYSFTDGKLYVGDTSSLDTLTLTTFTITYSNGATGPPSSLVIDYSNAYSNSPGGNYFFGGRMGGAWGGNSFQNTESLVASGKNLGSADVTQTLNGGAPSFNQPQPVTTKTGLCSVGYGGVCGETLEGTFTANFQRNGSLTFNNSLDDAAGPIEQQVLTYLGNACTADAAGDGANCTVPEPSSLLLLGTGLVGVVVFWRKRLLART